MIISALSLREVFLFHFDNPEMDSLKHLKGRILMMREVNKKWQEGRDLVQDHLDGIDPPYGPDDRRRSELEFVRESIGALGINWNNEEKQFEITWGDETQAIEFKLKYL